MPVRLRYYHYDYKDTENVSAMWKALHLFLFALIAINALVSAYAFNYIFDAFHYRCVLYAQPRFELKDLKYHNVKTVGDDYKKSGEPANLEIPAPVHEVDDNNTELSALTYKVQNVSDVEIINGTFWVNNRTLSGQVSVEIRGTVFTNVVLCDWVMFTPLTTFVVAAFFGVLFLIFEKGGRGYQSDSLTNPTSVVYPCLIVSAVMTLISIVNSNILYDGLRTFCSHFQPYTRHNTCTKLMDLFTKQRYFGNGEFYLLYRISVYSFVIGIVLWILQLVLNILRVVFAADFQLTSTLVRTKYMGDHLNEDEVHEVVINQYPLLAQANVVKEVISRSSRRSSARRSSIRKSAIRKSTIKMSTTKRPTTMAPRRTIEEVNLLQQMISKERMSKRKNKLFYAPEKRKDTGV